MASQKLQCTEGERTRCEVWTRVMGYFRPVSFFNTGKKSEHYFPHLEIHTKIVPAKLLNNAGIIGAALAAEAAATR